MKNYKVSIVLIVYNTEDWIEECLASINSQTLKELEIVIVNNNSNDATNTIIEQFIEGHANIVYVKCTENVGGATAGNIGIKKASGDYVFIMDSDDKLPENAIEYMYAEAIRTDADIIIGRGKSIINNKIYNNKFKADLITWSKAISVSDLREAPQLAMAPFYWGKLYRRSMLLEHQIFMIDGMINADRYFNSKALKMAKGISVITDVCYYWRRYENSDAKQSVTQQRAVVPVFLDRMQSIKMTDALFEEQGYEAMHDFICRAGLLRLMIMVNDIKDKDEFSEVYLREMSEYLAGVRDDLILQSEMFTSRQKVLLYLMKYKRYEELYNVLLKELVTKPKVVDNMIVYEYSNIQDIPKEAFIELKTEADICIGKIKKTLFGKTRIYITLPTWKKARISIEAVYLMFENKTECQKLELIQMKPKGDTLRCYIELSKKLESYIEDDYIYYLSILYTINDIKIHRMRITNSNGVLLCIRREEDQVCVRTIPNKYTIDKKARIVKRQ